MCDEVPLEKKRVIKVMLGETWQLVFRQESAAIIPPTFVLSIKVLEKPGRAGT